MSLVTTATRAARRMVDVLLVVLIGGVLLAVVLARGLPFITGGSTFVVAGGSMEPTIPMGSVVLATPVAANQLQIGDVVSLQTGPERAVFTHRVVRLATLPDGTYIETKGDANPTVDPALVAATDVVGRVELSVPYAGFGVALLSTLQGVLFVISIAALLITIAWLLESIEDEQRAALGRSTQASNRPARPEPTEAEGAA